MSPVSITERLWSRWVFALQCPAQLHGLIQSSQWGRLRLHRNITSQFHLKMANSKWCVIVIGNEKQQPLFALLSAGQLWLIDHPPGQKNDHEPSRRFIAGPPICTHLATRTCWVTPSPQAATGQVRCQQAGVHWSSPELNKRHFKTRPLDPPISFTEALLVLSPHTKLTSSWFKGLVVFDFTRFPFKKSWGVVKYPRFWKPADIMAVNSSPDFLNLSSSESSKIWLKWCGSEILIHRMPGSLDGTSRNHEGGTSSAYLTGKQRHPELQATKLEIDAVHLPHLHCCAQESFVLNQPRRKNEQLSCLKETCLWVSINHLFRPWASQRPAPLMSLSGCSNSCSTGHGRLSRKLEDDVGKWSKPANPEGSHSLRMGPTGSSPTPATLFWGPGREAGILKSEA